MHQRSYLKKKKKKLYRGRIIQFSQASSPLWPAVQGGEWTQDPLSHHTVSSRVGGGVGCRAGPNYTARCWKVASGWPCAYQYKSVCAEEPKNSSHRLKPAINLTAGISVVNISLAEDSTFEKLKLVSFFPFSPSSIAQSMVYAMVGGMTQ